MAHRTIGHGPPRLVTASSDGVVKVWGAPSIPVDEADERLHRNNKGQKADSD